MLRGLNVLMVLMLLGGSLPYQAQTPPQPSELLEQIRTSSLQVDQARTIEAVNLNLGAAHLRLEQGTLFPVSSATGLSVEMIFLGQGSVTLEAPDNIEAGQLELFTGDSELSASFEEAVLVIARDVAAESLLSRPPADVSAATVRRARETFQAWRRSPVPDLLGVEQALLDDALGDPFYQGYFAASFASRELGDFLISVDPGEREQISVGQFVPLDLDTREQRRLSRRLHREQRRGRLIGVDIDELGTWDTWVSTSSRNAEGEVVEGYPSFEPTLYRLDVTADPRSGKLQGSAEITLLAMTGLRRTVHLQLATDLVVRRVTDEQGAPLFSTRTGSDLNVILPEAPDQGENVRLNIEYDGKFFDRIENRNWALRETLLWYPNAGEINRAAYDVTLRWPQDLDLVASGLLREEGVSGDLRWQRRVQDFKSVGFSFEIGRYEIHTQQVGHVTLKVAFGRGSRDLPKDVEQEIIATVADSLAFYEEVFSPYPLDELTVVTAPRSYSQAMLGFITLSDLMIADLGLFGPLLGLEDRRTVIAHEVAHQWWAHIVGWKGYRDQWISEATANYAAMLWARRRLPARLQPRLGPTTGWQAALSATLPDGRPVEAVGPLVLGARLESSKTANHNAYIDIVYRKGAIILDSLAGLFGEETFLQMLSKITANASGKVISTETFLGLIERMSGADLSGFGKQFIYGTGLPNVYYSFDFSTTDEGGYTIKIEAEQETPYRFEYQVVDTPKGLDVERQRLDLLTVNDSRLVVPFQIALEPEGSKAKRKNKPPVVEILSGRMEVSGEHSEVQFDLERKPRALHLDLHKQVFGRFINASLDTRHSQVRQGIDLVATAQRDEARALLLDILDQPRGQDETDQATGLIEGRVQLALTRLALEESKTNEAERHFQASLDILPRNQRWWYEGELTLLESRIDLQKGDHNAAYRRLRKKVLKGGGYDAEGYLLLAIAAKNSGQKKDFAKALKIAEAKGADVGKLKGVR